MIHFNLRPATLADITGICRLYKEVSETAGGLARRGDEITTSYVTNFSEKSIQSGIQLVIESHSDLQIVGEIHCYKLEPAVFDHILSDLTIAVHPLHQGKGLGKALFGALLREVSEKRNDILRVELIARESNKKAIQFYQGLNFKVEGKLLNRIKTGSNTFEADIPMAWMNDNYPGYNCIQIMADHLFTRSDLC